MSALDRMDDSFPHGTPAGYVQGCRGNGACPAKHETGQSCKEASIRSARDSAYRALVLSGASVEVLSQPEVEGALPVERSAPRPAPHQAVPKMLRATHKGEPLGADTTGFELKAPLIGWQHGTNSGYIRGCRDDCPGDADGYTCRNAHRDAKRTSKTQPAPDRVAHISSPGLRGIESGTIIAPTPDALAAVLRPEPERTERLAVAAAELRETEAPPAPATLRTLIEWVEAALDMPLTPWQRHCLAHWLTLDPTDDTPTPGTNPEEARRSPQPRTPVDGVSGGMADVVRAAWLDGYFTRAGL